MERIFHSKKKNPGLLFELLSQQLISDTVTSNDIRAQKALYLIKKYFKPGTVLYEELQLVNSILYNEVSNWRTASKFLAEVIAYGKKLDAKKLSDEKYRLVSEINANFDKDEFYKAYVPSYRIYGAIYSLIEAARQDKHFDIAQKIKLEESVLNHLTDNQELKRIKTEPVNEQLDELQFAFLIKKFNQKYREILTETQKEVMKNFIALSDRDFQKYVEKKHKLFELFLYESMKKNPNLSKKTYEAMTKLQKIEETTDKNIQAEILLNFAQLVDEFKKLQEGK